MTLTIDIHTARRFILGKQGLWPGRRWRGTAGTEQAMHAMEYLQLDPLQIVARSHNLALHSRVIDYQLDLWEEVTYQQRKFFDWGGWLATRPMDELPYWRVVMRRERDGNPGYEPRIRKMGLEHADAIGEMRTLLHERGVLSNRDFDAAKRKRTKNYRGRKDSSLALYFLWRTGEVMTHHRENFERVYALTETVAPSDFLYEVSDDEADRFLAKKEISFAGLSRLSKKEQTRDSLLASGEIVEVKVEGWRPIHYLLSNDLDLLDDVTAGRVPEDWEPLETTTLEEVAFLAPLDPVCARGRAKVLFDFDYVWEVYKPQHKRRYGYYTLPVLWGDQLVARFDSKLDRTTNTLVILGLWLEYDTLGRSEDFARALAHGFKRLGHCLGAEHIEMTTISELLLRNEIANEY
jgi:uncharacterized protein